jgi:RNAse (barnase) inhibitor barstar
MRQTHAHAKGDWLVVASFGLAVVCTNRMLLVPAALSPQVLERGGACGLRVLGAEVFELGKDRVSPRLDRIADFSSQEAGSDALDEWVLDNGLFVEFVFDSDPEVVFIIDGADFDDLEGFFHAASKALMNTDWEATNLDSFSDILRSGFLKTPDGGYTLIWRNAARSARVLGHVETAQWLRMAAERCHPTNRGGMLERLCRAELSQGETLFEIIMQIILSHCEGGSEEESKVHFVLEA